MTRPADLIFPERITARDSQTCVWCGGPAVEFRDELSRKEYGISMLCQKCQDEVFKEEGQDDF